jgi:hypothetical protein
MNMVNETEPAYTWIMCTFDCAYRAIYRECGGCVDTDVITYETAYKQFGENARACDRSVPQERECIDRVCVKPLNVYTRAQTTRRVNDPKSDLCGKGSSRLKVKSNSFECPYSCEEWDVRTSVTSVQWPRRVSGMNQSHWK